MFENVAKMNRKIILLAETKPCSGNKSTIERIGSYLSNHGYECHHCDTRDFDDSSKFLSFISSNGISAAVGIHAYKAGHLLEATCIPYVLILGGTDVNHDYENPDKFQIMTRAVNKARYVVAFGDTVLDRYKCLWPNLSLENVKITPQGVEVNPTDFSLFHYLASHNHIPNGNKTDTSLFVLVGGIRKVKSPLYLVQVFSEWHRKCLPKKVFLVIIGPEVEEDYYNHFRNTIKSMAGIVYVPGLSIGDTHACIQDAAALVNSSESEGMAITILEAMKLGTPVLARKNEGNCGIIQDGVTGLIFNSPEMFVRKAELLLQEDHQQKVITQNALQYVEEKHNCRAEETEYLSMVDKILSVQSSS